MSTVITKEMTPDEAALFLAALCEKTASGSQDWDNMREIFKSFIEAAQRHGFEQGQIAAVQSAIDAKK